MEPWNDQLERLPGLSNEEKDNLMVILNDPTRVRDPGIYFAPAARAVGRLKKLLYPGGQRFTPPGNDSRTLIREHLWCLPEPQLPQCSQHVEAWLFPSATPGQPMPKIPVTNLYYQHALTSDTDARDLLTPAGESNVAVAFTALLMATPQDFSSEMDTSILVAKYLHAWVELNLSPSRLKYHLSFNETEKSHSHSSKSVKEKARPDAIVTVSKCSLMLGEDKHKDMQAAFKDLASKRVDLSRLHYAKLTFLMGYAAAGTVFQWCWLPHLASQDLETVGPQLDLQLEHDRWIMLRSLVQVYRLLTVMSRNVAQLPGRMALYEIVARGDDREVQMLGTAVLKTIRKFSLYAKEQKTDFAAIEAAYSAANEAWSELKQSQPCPFLITCKDPPGPRVFRHDCYKVTTQPCGYKPEVQSEQDLHALAVSCCQAAQILHAKGLVHRDLRLDNVIQLGPQLYMVIDLESAARSCNSTLPPNFSSVLRTCSPAALEDGKYTPASDMYTIGCLLESALDMPSAAAQAFIDDLQQKRLDAGEAMDYLKSRWVSPDLMQS